MSFMRTLKNLMLALILAVAYSAMVIDIIQILKVRRNAFADTYPPAVVAMLVAAILQMLWALWYLIRGGRGAIFKASSYAGAVLFFLLFHAGATAAATALRHKDRYCPSTASNVGDCRGVFRGTMGLGWSLVGLNLIYLIYLAVFVPKHGNWSTEMHHIPPRVVGNAEMDKAPTH